MEKQANTTDKTMNKQAKTIDKTMKQQAKTIDNTMAKPSQHHRQHNGKTKPNSQTRERKISQHHRQEHERRSKHNGKTKRNAMKRQVKQWKTKEAKKNANGFLPTLSSSTSTSTPGGSRSLSGAMHRV